MQSWQNLTKTIEQLVDYAKNPQPTTVLVFNYKYKTLDKRKALFKTLSKKAIVLKSDDSLEAEARRGILKDYDSYFKRLK